MFYECSGVRQGYVIIRLYYLLQNSLRRFVREINGHVLRRHIFVYWFNQQWFRAKQEVLIKTVYVAIRCLIGLTTILVTIRLLIKLFKHQMKNKNALQLLQTIYMYSMQRNNDYSLTANGRENTIRYTLLLHSMLMLQ